MKIAKGLDNPTHLGSRFISPERKSYLWRTCRMFLTKNLHWFRLQWTHHQLIQHLRSWTSRLTNLKSLKKRLLLHPCSLFFKPPGHRVLKTRSPKASEFDPNDSEFQTLLWHSSKWPGLLSPTASPQRSPGWGCYEYKLIQIGLDKMWMMPWFGPAQLSTFVGCEVLCDGVWLSRWTPTLIMYPL